MATLAVEVGHIIVGDGETVLRADVGFAAILRACLPDIVGQRGLDMVAAKDRQLRGDLMQALRAGGRRAHRTVFDRKLFTDVAWDVLLAAHVAEARGEALSWFESYLGNRILLSTRRGESYR